MNTGKTHSSLLAFVALVCTAALFGSTNLYADSISCPNNVGFSQPISDNVSNSTVCEIGSTNNDSVAQVNADTMFNFSDWISFSSLNGTITGLGNVNATSGTINLSGVDWSTFGNLMLVFKDGEDAQPTNYVGYLIQDDYTGTVSWTTPFLNLVSGNAKDTSHINAYVTLTQVPEPASIMLLGLALAALGGRLRSRVARRP